MHVHVQSADGEAKFWLEPQIELAQNYGLKVNQITTLLKLVQEHEHEIRAAWHDHFGN